MPNRVRELRQLMRLSQRELASRVGMTGSEIHKIETGDRRLTQAHIDTFARFFGVSGDDIMRRAAPLPSTANGIKAQLASLISTIERMEETHKEIYNEVITEFRALKDVIERTIK